MNQFFKYRKPKLKPELIWFTSDLMIQFTAQRNRIFKVNNDFWELWSVPHSMLKNGFRKIWTTFMILSWCFFMII